MKRVLILGSTGSIGVQALEVVAACTDVTVVGLSCGSQVGLLLEQAESLGCTELAVADEAAAARVSPGLYPELRVRSGAAAAARLVREVEADLVLNAVVGFAGLEATLASLEVGTGLALANKESLVSGGRVVTGLAARRGIRILPVDSEHSALFQLLASEGGGRSATDAAAPGSPTDLLSATDATAGTGRAVAGAVAGVTGDLPGIRSLVLTASGGPFRGRTREQLAAVAPADALAHPTWTMGAKITIDSATLMNKGLEVIEAHHLFGVPYGAIEVVIHPQSLVHSLVRLVDGALLAHLGLPDMRVPISYALHYPKRRPVAVADLDLTARCLEFVLPDLDTFSCLPLAREAGVAGDAATCAMNAANEVAVDAFLQGRLPFLGIADVIARVLEGLDAPPPGNFEEIATVDGWARRKAVEALSVSG